MTKTPTTINRPFPGHLIVADDCQFFKTTDVRGQYRVSTIGEYRPKPEVLAIFAEHRDVGPGGFVEIGYGRLYETMVFPLSHDRCAEDCGGPCAGAQRVSDWSEVDTDMYNTRRDAELGHAKMVRRYLAKTRNVGTV